MVKCSAFMCDSSSHKKLQGITFHRFPKNDTLKSVWVNNMGFHSWKPKPSSVLCSKHFESHFLDPSVFCTRLRPGAIPTLFEKFPQSEDNITPPRKKVKSIEPVLQEVLNTTDVPTSSKCGILQVTENLPGPSSIETPSSLQIFTKPKPTGPVLQEVQNTMHIVPTSSKCSTRQDHETVTRPPSMETHVKLPIISKPKNYEAIIKTLKSRIIKKNSKIKALQQHRIRLKKKVSTFSDIISNLKNKMNNDDIHILSRIPVENKEFFSRYLKKARSDSLEKSFSPEIRTFALQLHFYSPRAYNFVRTTFNTILPHPGTLSRWYKKVNMEPGFISESVDTLESIAKSNSNKIFVNLSIDEMALRKGLVWDTAENKFKGYVDSGVGLEDDSLPLATQALVILVNGINCRITLPIAYFFINSMTGEQRASLMKMAIEILHKINVIICGITFDGAASNISMATYLGCKLNLNNLEPNFMNENVRINIFYDPCHMVKLIRNTLGDFKVLCDKEGNYIKFEYFSLLLELQKEKGLHLANKIKEAHIYFNKQKMKVRLAVQLLSKSVADAFIFCRDQLKLSTFKDCAATVKFISIINDIFDVLNSRTTLAPGNKKALCAANIVKTKELVAYWRDYLQNLRFLNGKLIIDSARKTGFIGFIICLESALNMFEDLIIREKLRFIPMYSVSQDHLEMFFGKMRARGGFNDNPNVVQFKSSIKRLIINSKINLQKNGFAISNTILHASSTTKYETVINDTTAAFERHIMETEGFEEEEIENFLNSVLAAPLDEYTHHVTVYIAGFLARKILKIVTCGLCHVLVLGEKDNFLGSLINFKDRGGLVYPSDGLIKIIQRCEKIYKLYKTKNVSYNAMISYVAQSFDYDLIFNSDNLEHDTNHVYLLIKLIVKKYIDLRSKHETKKESNITDRNYLKKIVLFKNK